MLNSSVNFEVLLNCEQDDPCSGKSITSCQHTHIYKNMTVGQINLSRENRFLSNSVNCTELERERCYFSSMKGKQDLSLFTLSSPFQKKVNLIPSLKKKMRCYLSEDTWFLSGWKSHIGALCLFLWPETQGAGLSLLMLWRCQKGRDTVC